MPAENAAGKQRGRPFKPGQSGNPAGRAKGTRNKATLAIQALLDGEGEALARKCVQLALEGDPVALRLCMERLLPHRRDSPVVLPKFPRIENVEDLACAAGAILKAVAAGDLTPSEGMTLAALVKTCREIMEQAGGEAGADDDFKMPSPEEMAARAAARIQAIKEERENFVPERREQVRAMKEEMGNANNPFREQGPGRAS